MALAYTPGLKVKAATIVRKTRRLPIPGEVLVKVNDAVSFDTVVAKTTVPGEPATVDAMHALRLTIDDDLSDFITKNVGDEVEENEVIAKRVEFFGLSKSFCKSPIRGTIELISPLTGQVVIRGPPISVEVTSYVSGIVVQVLPREGVVIETSAAFIQGIFGVGGETHGELITVGDSPSDILTAEKITSTYTGKILTGGALVTGDALHKAIEAGVKGIIVGGIEEKDLANFLGYDVGVAITGREDVGLTLIITEGFGKMNMSIRTFELLKSFDGREAAMNGATQIRAGVIRPEIIIPRKDIDMALFGGEAKEETFSKGMMPGMRVRIISNPNFGCLGHIVSLPVGLQQMETESNVRVLEVELDDGRTVIEPRANVEIIEE